MTSLAFISNLGGPDLIVILLIILVLFGAKRLPDLAKGMGQAMREFHKAKDDFTSELHQDSQPPVPDKNATAAAPRLESPSPSASTEFRA